MYYLIFRLVFSLLRLLEILIVVRALCSWFPQVRGTRVYDFIYTFTEPLIKPIRSLLYKIPGMDRSPLDFSSLFALFILCALEELLRTAIY